MTDTIHVLYVDDEPDLLFIGKSFLELNENFTVTTASGAAQALELLKSEIFDVVVSDYQMPGTDGIEFLKQHHAANDSTPFILFTGKGREEVVIEALNNGADFYLQKGDDTKARFEELSNIIRHTVSGRHAGNELLEYQKRIADVIDFFPDATYAINNEGVVIAWNRAMEELSGISREEMVGKGDYAYTVPFYGEKRKQLLDLIDLDDAELESGYQSVQRKGNIIHAETFTPALYQGKGAYVWATAAPLYDIHGNRVGGIESIREITDKKHAEQALQRKNIELQAAYEQIAASEEELRANIIRLTSQEETIRVNEERLVMAQEISLTGCWEYNIQAGTIWGSAEGLRIFGFPPVAGNFPINNIEDCIPERERVHQALVDLLAMGREYNLVYDINPADGSARKTIHSVARLERDHEGNPVRVIGAIQDITEQKRSETALQESEAKYRGIFENSILGLFKSTPGGELIEVNNALARMYGYRDAARMMDLRIDAASLYARSEERQHFVQSLLVDGEVNNYEVLHITREGTTFWVAISARVIRDKNGVVLFFEGSVMDVNERKAAESALRTSENHLHTLIRSIPDLVWLKDKEGVFLSCNKMFEQLFGALENEIVGKTDYDFVDRETADFFRAHDLKAITAGKPLNNEEWVTFIADGHPALLETIKTPIFDDVGSLVGVLGIGRDITDRKKTEEALKETNEAFSQAQKIARVGNWMFDLKTNMITWSDQLYRIFGYEPGGVELTLDTIRAVFHPDDLLLHDRILATAIETHYYEPAEYRVIYPDGSLHYINADGSVETDENDETVRLIGVFQDITDRKLAEQDLLKKNYELQAAYEEIAASEEELHSNLEELLRQDQLIRESKERFQSLYENMIEGSALHELVYNDQGVPEDYRIVEINPAFEKQLGILRETVIGKTSREAYSVSEPPYLDIYVHTALTGEPATFETYFPPMGKYFSISVYCPYKGSFATIFEDITGRKLTEEAILASENRLKEAQQLALIGNWEFDHRTRHLICSDMVFQICEIPPSQFNDTFKSYLEFIQPEDRDKVRLAYLSSVENKSPLHVEHRLIMADGRIKYVTVLGETKYDPAERPLFSRGTIQDITERKTAEIRLQETTTYLENLISIANVPIIVWDPAFRITRLNHAFELLIGRAVDDVIGTSLALLFPPDKAERSMRLLQTTLDGVRWETTEIDIMHSDGSFRTILWNSSTLYAHDGLTPVATIAQGHDITRERELEQENYSALSQIKKNLAFLAILNDEIRNPLTIISACAEMITDNRVIDMLLDQIRRIDMMVTQLDRQWIESEKILEFLRKHHQIQFSWQHADSYGDGHQHEASEERIIQQPNQKTHLEIGKIPVELYTILDSIEASVFVSDIETYDLLYINKQGREIFGHAIGENCYQFLNRDGGGPCLFCTNQLLADNPGETGGYHREYQNPVNGRWYDCHDQAIRWSDGRLVRLEIATDITRHKEAEKALARERSLLVQAESISRIGSWHVSLETGKIIWSDEIYRIYGVDQTSVTGDLREAIIRVVHPEDRPYLEQKFSSALKGEPQKPADFRLLFPDGSIRWIHTESEPIYSDAGTITGFTGFTQDITEYKRVETIMNEQRQRLENIIEGTRAGTWEWNVQTGETTFNERWAEMLGYTLDELAPCSIKTWESLVHPDDLIKSNTLLDQHFSGQIAYYDCECRMKHKSGHWVWVQDRGKIITRTPDGRPLMMFGTHTDIHERKLADIALQESESRYKYVSETTTDFVFSCRRSEEGVYSIAWIAGAVGRITGYSGKELISMGCWRSLVLPEDLGVFDEHVLSIPPGTSRSCSLRIRTKGGEMRWLSVNTTHISEDASASSDRLIGACKDITDERLVINQIQENEERFRTILNSIHIGIIIVDAKTHVIIDANGKALEMIGHDKNLITGSLCHGYICPAEKGKCPFTDLGQKIDSSECILLTQNGEEKPVLKTVIKTRLEGKEVLIETLVDITVRKQIEEAHRESNRKLRLLTGLTRHDIFNQLSAIEILQNLALLSSDTEKIHDYISQAKLAEKNIETIIGFTREYENFGVSSSGWQLIWPLIESSKKEVALGNISVENLVPPDQEIYADPIIRKVFTTLLENAVRHGGEITRIRFFSGESDHSLVITCEDDGSGIPTEGKERIFEHGYGKNTGIGLFLAREILSITGLSIRENGDPGKGARFEILVPKGKFRRSG